MQFSPRRIVIAIADAMFEIEGSEAKREARLGVLADEVLGFASSATFVTRMTLGAALFVIRFAPLLFLASWRSFDRLDRDDRLDMIARIERSILGLAFVAWRTLIVLHFYEDARELASVGYRDERKRHLAIVPVPATSGVRLIDEAREHEEHEEEEKGAA